MSFKINVIGLVLLGTLIFTMSSVDAACTCSTSKAGTYLVNTSSLPLTLRAGHGSNYAKKASMPKGSLVKVTAASSSWAHVVYNGISGYASMQYLYKVPTVGEATVRQASSSKFPVQSSVKITRDGQVVDTFNGVSAIYPVAGVADGNTTYNCAAYVKKYYQKHFGFAPYNLLPGKTPIGTNSRYFKKVYDPRPGDIIGMTSSAGTNGHWGICKGIEGNNIVLIEQNKRSKSTYSPSVPVNRRISKYDVNIYHW